MTVSYAIPGAPTLVMEEPTDRQVLDAISKLHASAPELGRAKMLATLRAQNEWNLGNKRFKKLLAASDINQGCSGAHVNDMTGGAEQRLQASEVALLPIPLPEDAHAAQVRYMATSRRCFKIYGRGPYDYGVSPNMDQQILIGICHNHLLEIGAPGPWTEAAKAQIACSGAMVTIWNYWWAAGRKVGLTKEDIGRQLEAEYGVDPTPWLPVLTKEQIEHGKAEFKAQSMELKRAMLKEYPEGRQYIPIDAYGEPVWDEKVHGQYAVLVVEINKGDGLTEYGPVE